MNLKDRAVNGFLWSFIERFAAQIVTFIVGLVLARLLSPREFGLIGMMAIFIGISTVFIQSGFNQALIRKNDCTESDFSTVFYFNLLISLAIYLILYFSAGLIGDFYEEPKLKELIRVLGISLIINAFTIVQRTKLTKRIDFKLLTKISVSSSIISGTVAIAMAATGFGVWSLVAQRIIKHFFEGSFLWFWNKWKPSLVFSIDSFKELWSFGSRLMVLGIFNTIHREIYQMIIGKFYPAAQLGQFNRAETFKRLPQQNLNSIIQRVTLPVMAPIQDNFNRLQNAYKKLINATFLFTSLTMVTISAISIELVEFLIGEKWHLAGEYLQILCISAIWQPLGSVNQNILKTKNKANKLLTIGIFMKLLTIPLIFILIFVNIKTMLYAMIGFRFMGYSVVAYYGGRLINFGIFKQIKDFIPIALLVIGLFLELTLLKNILTVNTGLKLIILLITAILTIFSSLELFKFDSYLFLKSIVKDKINSLKIK